jgi:hypothetical protein
MSISHVLSFSGKNVELTSRRRGETTQPTGSLKSFLSFEKEEIKEKTYGDGIFFGT